MELGYFLCYHRIQIVYPGDDGSVEELIHYYHHHMYTEREIRRFCLLRHGKYLSMSKFRRYKKKLGLRRYRSEASPEDIAITVKRLLESGLSDWGYKSLWRHINVVVGVRVTQETVRLALKALDPEGVLLRSKNRLRRRVYVNKGPNYMMHVDGYDKLKTFGFSIHGAVDGFSRKVLWLKVLRSNKNPYVVSKCYFDYVAKLKRIPRIIRCDAGTENVVLCDIHKSLRKHTDVHFEETSVIVGRSTGNQRIEYFWSFLKRGFTQYWRNIFMDFQDRGLLNTANLDDVEALRLCFKPLIQRHLDIFADNWNGHRIRMQRDIELTSGAIPEILYYQPELYYATDCSLTLPCTGIELNQLASDFSVTEPEQCCSEVFFGRLLLASALPRQTFEQATDIDAAREMFVAIKQILA